MPQRRWQVVSLLSLALVPALWGTLRRPAAAAPNEASPAAAVAADPMQEVTPEREAAALTFAKRHHPELASLLEVLKTRPRDGYDDAVRDLFRTSERLTKLKARSPERYELELQLWKVDSRIRLLAARLVMEDNDELRGQLRELLREKTHVREALLRDDRTKAAAKVEKLDSDIAALRADPETSVDQDLEKLLKAAKATAQRNNRKSNSAEPKSDGKAPAKSANTSTKQAPVTSTPTP